MYSEPDYIGEDLGINRYWQSAALDLNLKRIFLIYWFAEMGADPTEWLCGTRMTAGPFDQSLERN